jgi:large subunit ribosomal protein L6e
VPIRRVNHRYVIGTSTTVDITGVDEEVLDRVSKDEYWAREKKDGKGEEEFFKDSEPTQKKETDPQRIEDQKKVDKAIMANIRKVQDLETYLAASFSLRGNERPHEMVF